VQDGGAEPGFIIRAQSATFGMSPPASGYGSLGRRRRDRLAKLLVRARRSVGWRGATNPHRTSGDRCRPEIGGRDYHDGASLPRRGGERLLEVGEHVVFLSLEHQTVKATVR